MRLSIRWAVLFGLLVLFAGCAMSERQATLLETQALAGDAATLAEIESKAREGDPVAELTMGRILAAGGTNVSRDEAKAFSWFKKSADHGNARAETNVGLFLANGRGTKKDAQAAIPWLKKGATKGVPLAQAQLGVALLRGEGTAKDVAQGMQWLGQAEKSADATTLVVLASVYESSAIGDQYDSFKTNMLLRKAAARGHSAARAQLARRILAGKAGGDALDAVSLLEQSGTQGDSEALFALANIYANGAAGVPKDKAKGCALYAKAAQKENADSLYYAARCALDEDSTEDGRLRAGALMRRADRAGSLLARMTLRFMPEWPKEPARAEVAPRPDAPPSVPQRTPPQTESPSALHPPAAAARLRSLFEAAREGDVPAVRKLLEAGSDPNMHDDSRSGEGQTALHQAMRAKDVTVAELLIARGADVNAKAKTGYTPLHVAAGLGKLERVRLLLSKGASVDAMDTHGTPLHAAVVQGQEGIVEALLAAGANPDARVPLGEETPLVLLNHVIFFTPRHDAIVRRLVEAGADVNARSKWGDVPIAALYRAKEDTALLLIEKGARTQGVRVQGQPILYAYAGYGKLRVVQSLVALGHSTDGSLDLEPLVHYVADRGQVKVLEWLLGKGVDVNSKSKNGRTPLHAAATHARLDMISFLLDHGADPNAVDEQGRTPLFPLLATPGMARYAEQQELKAVNLFRRHGAKFDHLDSKGEMPLHWFVENTYISVGPDIGTHCEIVYQLSLATGIDARTRAGDNILHVLARRERFSSHEYIVPRFARCLIDMGADPNARNGAGETPSDVARQAFPNSPHPILKVLAEPNR
jgi:ankyrin repeat protein/TPR repeat protein